MLTLTGYIHNWPVSSLRATNSHGYIITRTWPCSSYCHGLTVDDVAFVARDVNVIVVRIRRRIYRGVRKV